MAKKTKKKVAVVCCNGGSELKAGITRDAIIGDCSQISAQYPEGILQCAYGCLGGGSCVAVCRLKAISISPKHIAKIDRDKCIGCGLCVKTCPQQIIKLVLPENVILPQCSNHAPGAEAKKQCSVSCIACRICEKNCPAGAISVIDNCATIDQNRCIACGMCAAKCPRGVIVDANGIFTAIG